MVRILDIQESQFRNWNGVAPYALQADGSVRPVTDLPTHAGRLRFLEAAVFSERGSWFWPSAEPGAHPQSWESGVYGGLVPVQVDGPERSVVLVSGPGSLRAPSKLFYWVPDGILAANATALRSADACLRAYAVPQVAAPEPQDDPSGLPTGVTATVSGGVLVVAFSSQATPMPVRITSPGYGLLVEPSGL